MTKLLASHCGERKKRAAFQVRGKEKPRSGILSSCESIKRGCASQVATPPLATAALCPLPVETWRGVISSNDSCRAGEAEPENQVPSSPCPLCLCGEPHIKDASRGSPASIQSALVAADAMAGPARATSAHECDHAPGTDHDPQSPGPRPARGSVRCTD